MKQSQGNEEWVKTRLNTYLFHYQDIHDDEFQCTHTERELGYRPLRKVLQKKKKQKTFR